MELLWFVLYKIYQQWMNFDAAEVSLLVLFCLVICVDFFLSSVYTVPLGVVCPCHLRGPAKIHFGLLSSPSYFLWLDRREMAKVFLKLMLWGGIRSADFWQQIVIVTLSQLSVVRWHPQEECFLLVVLSWFWC